MIHRDICSFDRLHKGYQIRSNVFGLLEFYCPSFWSDDILFKYQSDDIIIHFSTLMKCFGLDSIFSESEFINHDWWPAVLESHKWRIEDNFRLFDLLITNYFRKRILKYKLCILIGFPKKLMISTEWIRK